MSHLDDLRAYCAGLPGVSHDYPFDFRTRVYRVGGKIFALTADGGLDVSLKCDPGLAEVLRHNFGAITPGYHLNKRHWNTIVLDGSVPNAQLRDLVDHSYQLVLAGLSKKEQARISGALP